MEVRSRGAWSGTQPSGTTTMLRRRTPAAAHSVVRYFSPRPFGPLAPATRTEPRRRVPSCHRVHDIFVYANKSLPPMLRRVIPRRAALGEARGIRVYLSHGSPTCANISSSLSRSATQDTIFLMFVKLIAVSRYAHRAISHRRRPRTDRPGECRGE